MTQAGQSSEVKCPTGMKGTTKRACNLDGTWAPADPECRTALIQMLSIRGNLL